MLPEEQRKGDEPMWEKKKNMGIHGKDKEGVKMKENVMSLKGGHY